MKTVWVEFDLHPVIFMWVAGTLIYGVIMAAFQLYQPTHPITGICLGFLVGFDASMLFSQWLLTRARRRAEAHMELVKQGFDAMIKAHADAAEAEVSADLERRITH